jgi:type I restriction enzyme S subunit
LYYFFQGPHFKSFIQLKILGSSVPHIFQRDMQDFTSVIPPVVEQKKIAEILTTVDEAIGKSNEIIEKTKELKKGLMQELLARGIGHKRFKKTKIGEIPVDWVVVKLSDVAAKQKYAIVDGPFGSNLKLKDYVDSGIPVLQGKNITSNRLEWFDIRYVTEEKARELSRSLVKVGDILITKIGTVGCSAIVDDLRGNKVALIPANLMKISLNEKKVNCKYLHQWLVWSETKKRIVDTASQTAQPALSLKVMKPFKVTLPPLPEQKKIAEILSAVDEEIEKETANKEKLEQTKKGLMQVLLTGKKRV